jgi:hypothetical protein
VHAAEVSTYSVDVDAPRAPGENLSQYTAGCLYLEAHDETVASLLRLGKDHDAWVRFNQRVRMPSEALASRTKPGNWVRDQGISEELAREVCGWAASDQLYRHANKSSTERSRRHRAKRKALEAASVGTTSGA